MNDSIPSKPGIVHDDMNLPVSKFRGLLYQPLQVGGVLNVSSHTDSSAWGSVIDGFRNSVGLGYL